MDYQLKVYDFKENQEAIFYSNTDLKKAIEQYIEDQGVDYNKMLEWCKNDYSEIYKKTTPEMTEFKMELCEGMNFYMSDKDNFEGLYLEIKEEAFNKIKQMKILTSEEKETRDKIINVVDKMRGINYDLSYSEFHHSSLVSNEVINELKEVLKTGYGYDYDEKSKSIEKIRGDY